MLLCVCVGIWTLHISLFTFTAPSIANVQAAIEHIYPLVEQFRMDKPEPRSSDMFHVRSATQGRHPVRAGAISGDNGLDWTCHGLGH